MSTIYLSFAGMIGSVKAENEINVTRNFLPFLEEPQNTDYSFEYISCEKLGNLQGKLLYAGKEYDVIQKENGDIIRVFKDHQEDDCVYGYSKLVPFENTVKIFYLKGNEQHFDDTNNSFFHSSWEQVMLWNKRMILHAALIDTVYGGILFSGKSGVGKQPYTEL